MGFIKVPLDDIKENEPVAEGEYELRIIKAEDTNSKAGNPMTAVTMRVEGIPTAALVRHWLVYPTEETPPDQRHMRLLDIKRFLHCFHIPMDGGGFDSADLEGQTGKCFVAQEEGDDDQVYNRLRLPRLR